MKSMNALIKLKIGLEMLSKKLQLLSKKLQLLNKMSEV